MYADNNILFKEQDVPLDYAFALARLLTACQQEKVYVRKIVYFQHGFSVMFEGVQGDAVIHDNSYGHQFQEFETYRMPWDDDDVSVHEPETLAKMLGALKRGESWSKYT